MKKFLTSAFLIFLASCGINQFPVAVSGIVSTVNQSKILALKHEIGDVIIFEIRAKVRTDQGITVKKEKVRAKIIGHKEFAGSVVRVFDTSFQNDKKLTFVNSKGTVLVIPSRNASDLGKEYDGGLDYLIAGYIDGRYVSIKELRSDNSLHKNGFQLLSYVAPEIKET